ncbi:MAG: hypothetical protein RR993_00640 [Clostridia bacterium]
MEYRENSQRLRAVPKLQVGSAVVVPRGGNAATNGPVRDLQEICFGI